MISPGLLSRARCPDCGNTLTRLSETDVSCSSCGRHFDASRGYLDLRPRAAFAEQTKYLDEALHADARHETVAPPVLGSRVRNTMLRRFLQLGPGDTVLDLGCGSGRTLVWNADTGASLTGVDISPFFSREALERAELVLGDVRRLPIADAAFTKAWSLDVFEHVSLDALREVLGELHRVLAPGGVVFVYTHVRKNGPLGWAVRAVNRLAAWCERAGLIDLGQERLRKSDHVNPLTDHDHLHRVAAECGFSIERLTYYTPVIGALTENVVARIVEHLMTRRVSRRVGDAAEATKEVRAAAKRRVRASGPTYVALRLASAVMMLDVALFGRVKSGPFFALLRKN